MNRAPAFLRNLTAMACALFLAIGTDSVGQTKRVQPSPEKLFAEALQLERTGNGAKAIELIEQAEKNALGNGDTPTAIAARGLRGIAGWMVNHKAAIETIDSAVALARREKKNRIEAATALATAGSYALRRERVRGARILLAGAIEVYPAGSEAPALGTWLAELGDAEMLAEDFASARKHFEHALKIAERAGSRPLDLARLQLRVATSAINSAANDIARDAIDRAEKIVTDAARGSVLSADLFDRHARLCRALGDLAGARKLHGKALQIYEAVAPQSLGHAEARHSLAETLLAGGDTGSAARTLLDAEAIAIRATPNSIMTARICLRCGEVVREMGELALARNSFRHAIGFGELVLAAPDIFEQTFLAIASLDLELHDHDEARRNLQEVVKISGWFGDTRGLAFDATLGLMEAAIETRDAVSAEMIREEIENGRKQKRLTPAREARFSALCGRLDFAKGRLEAAEQQFFAAIGQFAKLPNHAVERASAQVELAQLALKQGNVKTAAAVGAEALNVLRPARGRPRYGIRAFEVLARAQFVLGPERAGDANGLATEGWARATRLLDEIAGDDARMAFQSAHAPLADLAIRCALAARNVPRALMLMDEAHAMALRDLISDGAQAADATTSKDVVRLRGHLADWHMAKVQLVPAKRALDRATADMTAAARKRPGGPEQIAEFQRMVKLQETVSQIQAAVADARSYLSVDWESVHIARRRKNGGAPTFSETDRPETRLGQLTRDALPAGSLCAAFALDDDAGVLFLFEAGAKPGAVPEVTAFPIPTSRKVLTQLCADFTASVSSRFTSLEEVRMAGNALVTALLPEPARARMLASRRLAILPDGPLWEVPFAALPAPGRDTGFLGEGRAISLLPSLTVGARLARKAGKLDEHRLAALVVGDPEFPSIRPTEFGPKQVPPWELAHALGDTLAPLAAARKEAEQVAKVYGVDALLGSKAAEQAVRAQLSNVDVIHFATHGIFVADNPMASALMLARPAGGVKEVQRSDDAALQAWELFFQIPLRARIVVLSGCETGRGKIVNGEGVLGLTRSFQAAGVPSVVASLWLVDDASTAPFMAHFHKCLRAGQDKDQALSASAALLRENPKTAHPYFWAPFFLSGRAENGGLGSSAQR